MEPRSDDYDYYSPRGGAPPQRAAGRNAPRGTQWPPDEGDFGDEPPLPRSQARAPAQDYSSQRVPQDRRAAQQQQFSQLGRSPGRYPQPTQGYRGDAQYTQQNAHGQRIYQDDRGGYTQQSQRGDHGRHDEGSNGDERDDGMQYGDDRRQHDYRRGNRGYEEPPARYAGYDDRRRPSQPPRSPRELSPQPDRRLTPPDRDRPPAQQAFLPDARRPAPRDETLHFLARHSHPRDAPSRRTSFGARLPETYADESEPDRPFFRGGGPGSANRRPQQGTGGTPSRFPFPYAPGRTPAQAHAIPGNQGAARNHPFSTPPAKKEDPHEVYEAQYVSQMYRATLNKKYKDGKIKHYLSGGKTILYDDSDTKLDVAFFPNGIPLNKDLDFDRHVALALEKVPKKGRREEQQPARISVPRRSSFKPPSFVMRPPVKEEDDEEEEGYRGLEGYADDREGYGRGYGRESAGYGRDSAGHGRESPAYARDTPAYGTRRPPAREDDDRDPPPRRGRHDPSPPPPLAGRPRNGIPSSAYRPPQGSYVLVSDRSGERSGASEGDGGYVRDDRGGGGDDGYGSDLDAREDGRDARDGRWDARDVRGDARGYDRDARDDGYGQAARDDGYGRNARDDGYDRAACDDSYDRPAQDDDWDAHEDRGRARDRRDEAPDYASDRGSDDRSRPASRSRSRSPPRRTDSDEEEERREARRAARAPPRKPQWATQEVADPDGEASSDELVPPERIGEAPRREEREVTPEEDVHAEEGQDHEHEHEPKETPQQRQPGVLERLLSERKKMLGVSEASETLTPTAHRRAPDPRAKENVSPGIRSEASGAAGKSVPRTASSGSGSRGHTTPIERIERASSPPASKLLVEASPDRPSTGRASGFRFSAAAARPKPVSDDIEE
ncbi:hypothetical protein DFJ74DRAFT_763073 [Hyaloraphidium curvatum]|nr:hypothetical protein DFJ74DRAFT_763073 [Hyaloraphidium curvatum]